VRSLYSGCAVKYIVLVNITAKIVILSQCNLPLTKKIMATHCLNVVGSKGMQYGKVLKIHNITILLHKYLGV